MEFEELSNLVRIWSDNKGITKSGTPLAQADKTLEEAQEIKDAILENDRSKLIDGIGDTLVTLIIQAYLNNLDEVSCLYSAYLEIKDRKGKMQNGEFIKEEGEN